MISFRSVGKTYPGGTRAVTDVNLELPTGKLTVFVGPSGCGKTTCLRMINRMVEPTTGKVLIDGTDVRDVDAAQLRRGIGYVIQSVGLFPHRTVLDNIATVPVLQGAGRRRARADALALLDRVGLDPGVARRYPAQLSGGQQQRVGVARALAADPPVLLMDEPFSAVDPVVRAQLQDEMLRLQAELGKTVVFVTHDFDEALRLGDLIVVFAPGGRVAQAAEPATLLASPADDFVADFIGRDRGYRALSFTDAGPLPLMPVDTADVQEVTAAVDRAGPPPVVRGAGRWLLLVDGERRPQGWLDCAGLQAGRPLRQQDIRLGGTLIRPGGSLRSALDAALSSPSGDGVAVDEDGQLVGIVSAEAVLRAIERARDGSAVTSERPGAVMPGGTR
ncbi:MAG TPA: ATP-binding cassette domain-containing protein [Nakamurella sp.]|nr:ATP-binding cassette domain-containing protein [Nakamurella sp.]